MAANNLTYTFDGEGPFGKVVIWHGTKLIAARLKISVMRMDPAQVKLMADWIGFDMWRWLDIEVDRLPRGLTTDDVTLIYQIARDEMIEAGESIPA